MSASLDRAAIEKSLDKITGALAGLPVEMALSLLSTITAALIHDHFPRALDLGSVTVHASQIQRSLHDLRTGRDMVH